MSGVVGLVSTAEGKAADRATRSNWCVPHRLRWAARAAVGLPDMAQADRPDGKGRCGAGGGTGCT